VTAPVRARIVLALLVATAARADAQRASVTRQASRAEAIRAEMAGVLLQSKRYDEAVREYKILLARSPDNLSFRLGLARALAWGGRPVEAEGELRRLQALRPGNSTVETLLLSTRQDLRPTSAQARSWLDESRSFEYRQIYARALSRERRFDEALAQYDTLRRMRPSPGLLVERAQVNADRGDLRAAETDASASLAMGPSAEGYLLLGDLRRWRGNHADARRAYERARGLPHDDARLAARLAHLSREERPAVAFLPDLDDAPGWTSTSGTTQDNVGANLTTLALRRATPLTSDATDDVATPHRVDASVGVTLLRFASPPSATAATVGASNVYAGYGADGAMSAEIERGAWEFAARGRMGLLYHSYGETAPDASIATAVFYDAWSASVELATAPSYPSLLTMESFVPNAAADGQLRETRSAVAIAGPVGPVDAALRQELAALTDGNMRRTVQEYARLPMAHAALVFAATQMSVAKPSSLYWDPASYASYALGPEIGTQQPRGWSGAVRVLPALAWATERVGTGSSRELDTPKEGVFQLGGGADVRYRRDDWELGTAVSYGTGRAGSYQRLDAVVQLRWTR